MFPLFSPSFSLPLFPSAIRRREYLFFVGEHVQLSGTHGPCSAYSLGCSFLGKKYYRWSSLLSRVFVHTFHTFYHCFITRFRDFSVLLARTMPRPHRYKSNLLLLETRFIVIFDSMQVNRAAFSSFFLSHRVTHAFLSPLYQRGFFSPSVIETIGSSLFIPGTRDQRREKERERKGPAQIIMPGQMGLFLLLSPRRRVSHPALLVARVPRIHTTGARFFCGVPRGLRHGSSRDRPEGSTGSSLSLSLSSTGEILRLDFNTLASLISRSHSTFIPAASSPFNYNRRLLATPEGVKEVERVCNTLHSYLPDVTPTEVSRLTRAPTTYRHWYRRYQCHVYTCDICIYTRYFQTSFVTTSTRSIFEIR